MWETAHPPAAGAGGESIGALLSRVRIEQGKSQLRVAELLCAASGLSTITRHEVSRWEREERIPSGTWLRWLAVVLDTPLEELERAAAAARELRMAHARGQRKADMTFTREPRTAGAAGTQDEDRTDPVRPAPSVRHGPAHPWPAVPLDDPDAFRERLRELRRMDDLLGGPELAGVVHRELRAALTGEPAPTRSAGPPQHGEAARPASELPRADEPGPADLSLIAGLAQLAGWVAADAGAPVSTLATYRLGLRAADRAGDRPLVGHILGCLAQLTAEGGDHRAALRLARAAQRRAGSAATAATRALLGLRLAFAASVAGKLGLCEEALAAAERAWARRQADADPEWLYWLDEAHFTAMAGRCYATLGRPRLARPLLVAALDAPTVRFRARAITAAALARAHVDAGDLDAAFAVATDALMTCLRTGSVRATRQVRAVEPLLRGAAGASPAMREYTEFVASALPYLPAEPARARREAPATDQSSTHEDAPGRQISTMQDARGGPRPSRDANAG